MDLTARSALADSLRADETVATAVADAFYRGSPEWTEKFGEAGRRRCQEDARFHLSFLAGAAQAGSSRVFADYIGWCSDMLAARGIDAGHLVEHLDLLEAHLEVSASAQSILGDYFEAARRELATERSSSEEPPDQPKRWQLEYLSAALAGDRRGAWKAVNDAIATGISVPVIYNDVLVWTQRRLGRLWAEASISVAQEHMASAVTQSVVARLYAEIDVERTRGTILLGGVEGELHVLPAQLAADLLEFEGWDVAFLGTHVPSKDFIAAIEAEQPKVVGLSVTVASNLPATASLIRDIRARFPTLPIVLGGRTTRLLDRLADELDVEVADSLDVFDQYG
jgi:methanogenic corrinoid protein MtbC1